MIKSLVAAVALLTALPAFATTQHVREQVTFVSLGAGAHPGCLMFQIASQGGKQGINNSAVASGGDAGAPGYTGTALRYAVGIGTDATSGFTASPQPSTGYWASAGVSIMMIMSARYANGPALLLNFVDEGQNAGGGTPIYGDCGTASDVYAVGGFGQ
jgi:hypothetical protein